MVCIVNAHMFVDESFVVFSLISSRLLSWLCDRLETVESVQVPESLRLSGLTCLVWVEAEGRGVSKSGRCLEIRERGAACGLSESRDFGF